MIAPDLFQTSHYRFERLRCEWPSDPLIDWEQIKSLFLTLSPEDQGHCSRLVARYLSLCHRIGSRVGSPAEWIGTGGWTGFLEAERRGVRKLEATKTPAWVVEGTPAWMTWKRHRENKGQRMPSPEGIRSERGYGWWFPAPFPPEPQARRSDLPEEGVCGLASRETCSPARALHAPLLPLSPYQDQER